MKDRMFEVMLAGFGFMLTLQLFAMGQISDLNQRVNDIDLRLARIEGANSVRECRIAKNTSAQGQ